MKYQLNISIKFCQKMVTEFHKGQCTNVTISAADVYQNKPGNFVTKGKQINS